jgi:hypothetical protein
MRTKNFLLLSVLLTLLTLLAACSKTSNQAASNTSTTVTTNSQESASLSQVNMLLVGTLKLEDTDQAVTADQAENLLPFWQAYRSLSTSQTAAEAEVEALLNQIQSTMTTDQVEEIKAMNLTNTDLMNLMQSLGGGRMERGTPDAQASPGFDFPTDGFQTGNPPSGDFRMGSGEPPSGSTGGPRGNFPSGGVVIQGGPGGDAGSDAGLGVGPMTQGTPDPSMQATAQARFSTQANQVNSILLDVLITKLEAKTAN